MGYGEQAVSSVSTNLVLTARKALSLVLSVWWFGSGWNRGLALGGSLVFAGSVLYSISPDPAKESPKANGVKGRANGLHGRAKGKANGSPVAPVK
jgi:UDP-xylose/UDP-N-acetylglucosamine transporter B4